MDIRELLDNKEIKPKEKTEQLSEALISGSIKVEDLVAFAAGAKDSPKATCIEALEFATRQQPSIAREMSCYTRRSLYQADNLCGKTFYVRRTLVNNSGFHIIYSRYILSFYAGGR